MPNLLIKTIVRGITQSFFGLLVAHPFDTVKTRLQTVGQIDFGDGEYLYTGSIDCFRKIIKREGVLSLYKGVGVCLISVVPTNLITFCSYELLTRNVFRKSPDDFNEFELFILAALSGALPSVLTNPLERIKLHLQVPAGFFKHPPTTIYILRYIKRTEGILGMWRGMSLTIIRDANICGFSGLTYKFLTERYLQDMLHPDKERTRISEYIPFGICGGISGMIGWILATPIDFIKTRYQSVSPDFYEGGLTEVVQHIRHEAKFRNIEAWKYFFTGGKLVFLRAFFQFGVMYMGYEVYRDITKEKSVLELYQEEAEDVEDEYGLESAEPVVPFFSEIQIPEDKNHDDHYQEPDERN